MKARIILRNTIFPFLFLLFPFYSTSQWEIQHSGTSADLNCVFFINGDIGWAAGTEGTILYTTDGGESWEHQSSGTSFSLNSVHFVDDELGCIAGGGMYSDSGIILRTINGGENWEVVYLDEDPRFNDIFFIDSRNGWAVGEYLASWGYSGGYILHTMDGGRTWVDQGSTAGWNAIHFIDKKIGWAAGGFVNVSTGYPTCIMVNTMDGGNTWRGQLSSTPGGILFGVCFVDQENGWAAGGNPAINLSPFSTILHTRDGGANWETQNSLTNRVLTDICFINTLNGWAVGGFTSCGLPDICVILHTSDGGRTWEYQLEESSEKLNSVCFPNPYHGWVAGDNGTIMHLYISPSLSCLPEGITFTTQEEIDNFQTNYPGCTEIEGNVIIMGNDITNLTGLSVLTFIGGRLSIGIMNSGGNPSLTSLTGLNNLISIGGDLRIHQNEILTDLEGLEKLTSIGGRLWLYGNLSLTSLNGMINIASIGDDLRIDEINLTSLEGLERITHIPGDVVLGGWVANSYLFSLAGLNNVKSIGGSLVITNLDALTTLSGLDELEQVGGDLILSENDTLQTLNGLENLCVIEGSLMIGDFYYYYRGNPSLISLSGLDNLSFIGEKLLVYKNDALGTLSELRNVTSVGGFLSIYNNDQLISLSGLENISSASITHLFVYDNLSLSDCAVSSICNYLAAPIGDIYIYDNAPGCNSQAEVEEACGMVGVDELQVEGGEADRNPAFAGLQVYPNPAEEEVVITVNSQQSAACPDERSEIRISSQISLGIYDIYGRGVKRLVDEVRFIGEYTVRGDVSDLPAGVYMVRVQAGKQIRTTRLVVMR